MADAAEELRVTVNGEAHRLPSEETSVAALLRHVDFDPGQPGIAVAVDGAVVRRQEWSETSLKDGASVEVITAQQGG